MDRNDPQFIDCAMSAMEEGIPAQDIAEECACRLGLLEREAQS